MIPDTFTTRSARPRDQHEAWRERFHPTLDVVGQDRVSGRFPAENQIWNLGSLTMSRVLAPPVRVLRTQAQIRRDPVDHWVLGYCKQGTTVIRTDRALLEAPAGVPYLWSLGETSDSERTHVERVQLFLPRDAYRDLAPLLDAARAPVLDTPLGRLCGDYMLALERRLPTLTAADLPRLALAVRAMVAVSVEPSPERLDVAKTQIQFGQLERVRQVVRKNLRSATLGTKTLCRAAGISRSALYRLLEGAGGVARYIQRQRLLEAHAALSDPANSWPIAMIAEGLCFADASTFSRAFRREFGRSPTEIRSDRLLGMPRLSVPHDDETSQALTVSDLLCGF